MSRYFMRDTPLCFYERMMMTPPNFTQRGHGFVVTIENYTPEELDCEYCAEFTGRPCPLHECEYLMERACVGAITLQQLIKECFKPKRIAKLRNRLRGYKEHPSGFFLNESHRSRWLKWRTALLGVPDSLNAAVFLLTAYDELGDRVLPYVRADGIAFEKVTLKGIGPGQYAVYQAAKSIVTGSDGISVDDLAYPELVGNEEFRLIVTALLLARYGEVVFSFEEGRKSNAVSSSIV